MDAGWCLHNAAETTVSILSVAHGKTLSCGSLQTVTFFLSGPCPCLRLLLVDIPVDVLLFPAFFLLGLKTCLQVKGLSLTREVRTCAACAVLVLSCDSCVCVCVHERERGRGEEEERVRVLALSCDSCMCVCPWARASGRAREIESLHPPGVFRHVVLHVRVSMRGCLCVCLTVLPTRTHEEK